jgi:hypothetical protein
MLDIETKPAIAYTFGIRDQHITHKQLVPNQFGGIICVGVQWLGQKKVTVYSDWDHGHEEMLRQVHDMMSEADAIMGFNHVAFDLPRLQGEFLMAGMNPPPPPTNIDLYKTTKKMGFISNKLDFVAPLLGVGGKVKHEGLEMWIAVMNGCPKAQAKMSKYCAQDVRLLGDLYQRIKPYIANHPYLAEPGRDLCGSCGSHRLQARGFAVSKASKRQRYACQACGSWQLGPVRRIAA